MSLHQISRGDRIKTSPCLDRGGELKKHSRKDVLSEPVSVSFIFFQALITPEIKESLCKSGSKKKKKKFRLHSG